MPIKLGITGGIGSGKSIVAHLFKTIGIPVYIADTESKRLTTESPEIQQQLIALLGKEVYQNKALNKKLLANFIFASPDNAKLVNGIIHPVVKEDFRMWCRQHQHKKIVGIETAILFEAGFAEEVDYSIMVYAPVELRIKRTMQRDACNAAEVQRRINSQMSDEEKRIRAHFTIVNNDSCAIMPQAEEILQTIRNSHEL